jgi:hypothetical protein
MWAGRVLKQQVCFHLTVPQKWKAIPGKARLGACNVNQTIPMLHTYVARCKSLVRVNLT